jgi:hypothetical protein
MSILNRLFLVLVFIGSILFLIVFYFFSKNKEIEKKEVAIPFRNIEVWVNEKKGVNLREAPNFESKIIAVIPFSDKVTIWESNHLIEYQLDSNGTKIKTQCKRTEQYACFGVGEPITKQGVIYSWVEVEWKQLKGYAQRVKDWKEFLRETTWNDDYTNTK